MPAYEALPQKRICLIEIEKKCFGGEKRKEMNSPIYIFSLYSVKSSDMTCNKYAATDYMIFVHPLATPNLRKLFNIILERH
ncbi:hypothetical protein ACJIZ3_005165 [Penstemon smallii]|uniref:Uncharacterized protein n=1 Tax=Penstemon smallii TaxID=265156 RepID=A0ABD3S440_9LAMI